MNFSKAVLYSLIGTLLLIGVQSFLFGGKVFGLFLLLPLGFLFSRSKRNTESAPPRDFQTADPIEPK